MKKTMKLVSVILVLLFVATFALTACQKHECQHVCPICGKCTSDCTDPVCADKCPGHETTPTTYLDIADYRAYMLSELAAVNSRIGSVDDGGAIDKAVAAAYQAGRSAIESGESVSAVRAAFDNAKKAMAEEIPLANGVFSFTSLSAEEKTEILGLLEEYAINTGITGTTLYENGGYVMYSTRVTLGTETYIPGYGFGVLTEGSITGELANEQNAAWKLYYHSASASDPGTLNALDDQGSEVSDFYSYITATYYTTFMNSTKDGYDWVPELAAADPEPLNLNPETQQATTWRFEIRSGLKYSTLSSMPDRAAFNGRDVAPEDFITAFKLLFNQANGYFRGGEQAGATGAASIVGAKEYYDATENARQGVLSDEEADFSGVGVKVYEENGKWYFEYVLGAPVTEYYAKYYISSNLWMPVPEDFINLVGVSNYLSFNTDKTQTPVDNSLSLGAYIVERYDTGSQVVYKKNPNYVYADTKYQIAGVHINILTAATTDKEATIKEFLAGNIDAAGIPDTYLEEYQSDPRTRTTTGDSCFKLNMNALDAATWEKLFGVNGSVAQTPVEGYWEVEPALSNVHFRQALSYAINRDELAAIKGSVSSVNYFSSNYMSDPEKGISYNLTQAHQDAVASLLEDTENGYSLELARDYFRMALDELEASGAYTPGTKKNPTVIELEICWQYPENETGYHNYLKEYWESAFNDDSVSGGKYKLDVVFDVGPTWDYVYYDKMMLGQFDIGFGSISGNPLDPLAFMNVLSSDPAISGSFTLNWGTDTNDPNAEILVYKGMRWSFDALYKAATEVAVVADGAYTAALALGESSIEVGEDSATVEVSVKFADGIDYTIDDFVIFGYVGEDYWETSVWECIQGEPVVDTENNTVTYTLVIPESFYASLNPAASQGVDVYWSYSIVGHEEFAPTVGAFGGTYSLTFVTAE